MDRKWAGIRPFSRVKADPGNRSRLGRDFTLGHDHQQRYGL
jgi:hypothetical protein